MISDLRQLAENEKFPAVLFVFQGSDRVGKAILGERWPEARGIADPDLKWYKKFGIRSASLLQMVGPGVLLSGARATLKGHTQAVGRPIGDPSLLTSAYLVQPDGRITWQFHSGHVGDHPDWKAVLA